MNSPSSLCKYGIIALSIYTVRIVIAGGFTYQTGDELSYSIAASTGTAASYCGPPFCQENDIAFDSGTIQLVGAIPTFVGSALTPSLLTCPYYPCGECPILKSQETSVLYAVSYVLLVTEHTIACRIETGSDIDATATHTISEPPIDSGVVGGDVYTNANPGVKVFKLETTLTSPCYVSARSTLRETSTECRQTQTEAAWALGDLEWNHAWNAPDPNVCQDEAVDVSAVQLSSGHYFLEIDYSQSSDAGIAGSVCPSDPNCSVCVMESNVADHTEFTLLIRNHGDVVCPGDTNGDGVVDLSDLV